MDTLRALSPTPVKFGEELESNPEKDVIVHPFPQRPDTLGAENICASVSDGPKSATSGFGAERDRKIEVKFRFGSTNNSRGPLGEV